MLTTYLDLGRLSRLVPCELHITKTPLL